jgi:hypothetical protein
VQQTNNQPVQDTMMHHANNQQAQDNNNMVLQANKQSVDYKIMVQHETVTLIGVSVYMVVDNYCFVFGTGCFVIIRHTVCSGIFLV